MPTPKFRGHPQQAPAIHGRAGRQKVAVQAAEVVVIIPSHVVSSGSRWLHFDATAGTAVGAGVRSND